MRIHSRAPMTACEAHENVAEMKRKTSVKSQKQLLRHAIGGLGNLSDDARAVYAARLRQLEASA